MIFSCTNCGKRYRIEMSAYDGHAVRWSCAKCGQEHILRESDNPEESVVPVGQKGKSVQSNTEEIFTITSRSTRRESDVHGSATVRSGGWHVTVLGQRQGPLNDYGLMELLAAGKINSRTYIWRSPMATWVRMKDLKEVEGLLAQTAAGAAARRDSGSWPSRQTSPGIEIQADPPREPNPWDSRITNRADHDEPTGRHGIKATPTSQTAGGSVPFGRADELYRDLDNPGIDPRKADAVPPDDDEADRTGRGGYWHSPEKRREDDAIRETRESFGSEITQPGKRTHHRRPRDHRKVVIIGVVAALIAVGAIVVALLLSKDSSDEGQSARTKSNLTAASSNNRVDRPPAPEEPTPPAPQPQPPAPPAQVPTPQPTPVPAPVPAPLAQPAPGPEAGPDRKDQTREVIVPVPENVFDEMALIAFVQEQVPDFSTCRQVMKEKVATAISVNMTFSVAASGDIETLVITPSDINDTALKVCMQTIIRTWDFPPLPRRIGFKGTVVIP